MSTTNPDLLPDQDQLTEAEALLVVTILDPFTEVTVEDLPIQAVFGPDAMIHNIRLFRPIRNFPTAPGAMRSVQFPPSTEVSLPGLLLPCKNIISSLGKAMNSFSVGGRSTIVYAASAPPTKRKIAQLTERAAQSPVRCMCTFNIAVKTAQGMS